MKTRHQRKYLLPVVLILIYLIGGVFGAAAVCMYPIHTQRVQFSLHAEIIGQEYLNGTEDDLNQVAGPKIHIQIIDNEGNTVRDVPPAGSKDIVNAEEYIARYKNITQNGNRVFRIILFPGDDDWHPMVLLVIGVPIWQNDQIAGSVFMVKDFGDLPEAIFGFACYFTVLYWLSAYFVVRSRQKEQRLEKMRRDYVDNATHALKTPISSMRALLESLCDGVVTDPVEQQQYYGMMLQELNRQSHMVQETLDLSKLQSGILCLKKQDTKAEEIFVPLMERYAFLFDCANISLHVSDEVMKLPPLHTNAEYIRQVLEILLDNALKFAPEGGNVWIDAKINRKKAVIQVRDDGVGIKQEILPHVFDRFFKGDHGFNSAGNGLGLAIAQEIMKSLKEKIWVESEVGKGSSFYFTVQMKKS